jgi:hypothetical protein
MSEKLAELARLPSRANVTHELLEFLPNAFPIMPHIIKVAEP